MNIAVPEPKPFKPTKPGADASLNDWLSYLESIHSKPIDMGLDRVKVVQQQMNFALKGVVFTVAGTNGKGSTCAMLESILIQGRLQGWHVHLAAPDSLYGTCAHQRCRGV
jgi:dihydrofolate synthase/folylpolyglutamate synthase